MSPSLDFDQHTLGLHGIPDRDADGPDDSCVRRRELQLQLHALDDQQGRARRDRVADGHVQPYDLAVAAGANCAVASLPNMGSSERCRRLVRPNENVQRKGFSMSTPAIVCPCCMSSERSREQPLSAAHVTMSASQ